MGKCDRYIKIIQEYLSSKSIVAEGLLKNDIQDKNAKSLIYVSYAVEKFYPKPKLEKKIRFLASERGSNINDIKRNYYNQLTEFHALYVLTGLMNFKFIDFDMSSNKAYAKPKRDCDFLIEKNGHAYFAEAKDLSSEIMSTYVRNGYEYFEPVMNEGLERWIKHNIKESDGKGADFLIMHIPTWGLVLDNVNEENLLKFLQEISKGIFLEANKFFWKIPNARIKRLIFVRAFYFWEIEIV